MRVISTKLHSCNIVQLKNQFKRSFLCGSYELDESTGTKLGDVSLVDEDCCQTLLETINAGILDMKLFGDILSLALSIGTLRLYKVCNDTLEFLCEGSAEDEGYFLWSDMVSNEMNKAMLVSTQNSSVIQFDLNSLRELHRFERCHTLLGENMPVWCVASQFTDNNIFVSGGDDCQFKMWDLRLNQEITTPKSVPSSQRHTAGVTCVQWSPTAANVFATGSYDEHVKLWDARKLSQPLCDMETGGGVWRMRWLDSAASGMCEGHQLEYLVTANMQGGSRVLQIDRALSAGDSDAPRYEHLRTLEHRDADSTNPLIYGVDVLSFSEVAGGEDAAGKASRVEGEQDRADVRLIEVKQQPDGALCNRFHRFTMASCSFYENNVYIWDAVMPF